MPSSDSQSVLSPAVPGGAAPRWSCSARSGLAPHVPSLHGTARHVTDLRETVPLRAMREQACSAGERTGERLRKFLQTRSLGAVSKAVNRHRRFEGSNPSPSADNPNPRQRCGIEQQRGGRQARLSRRLKPLGTAVECRATVAQRRRVPSDAGMCPCGDARARRADRRSGVRNQRITSPGCRGDGVELGGDQLARARERAAAFDRALHASGFRVVSARRRRRTRGRCRQRLRGPHRPPRPGSRPRRGRDAA